MTIAQEEQRFERTVDALLAQETGKHGSADQYRYQMSMIHAARAVFLEYGDGHLAQVMLCYTEVLQKKIDRCEREALEDPKEDHEQ